MTQDNKKNALDTSVEDKVTEVYLVSAIAVAGVTKKFMSSKTVQKYPLVIKFMGDHFRFEQKQDVNKEVVLDVVKTSLNNVIYWR